MKTDICILIAACSFLSGCASPVLTRASPVLKRLDYLCKDFETCQDAPPLCKKEFYVQQHSEPTEEKTTEINAKLQKIPAADRNAWEKQSPMPVFPRTILLKAPPVGYEAITKLHAVILEDGSIKNSAICTQSVQRNWAFSRNAAIALSQWKLSQSALDTIGIAPFIAEIEFVFKVAP